MGFLVVYLIAPDLTEQYTLSKSNQTTQGEVIEVYPHIHDTCKYRFSVRNLTYIKTGRSCGHAHTGEQILIYYSPANPDSSMSINPGSDFVSDLVLLVIVTILFPLAAVFRVYKSFRQ
jgi:hypothetical protein